MSPTKISAGPKPDASQFALSSTLNDDEIQALLRAQGFPAAKIQEGRALHEAALKASELQQQAAGAQQLALRLLVVVEHGARDAYQTLARVVRAVDRDDQARLAALHVVDPMPDSSAPFFLAASVLFEAVRGIPVLRDFGYNEARMEEEREKIAAFYVANQRHEAACAAAERATLQLEAALKALNEWSMQYVRAARTALRGRTHLLAKLGVPAATLDPGPTPVPQRRAGDREPGGKPAEPSRAAKKQVP